MSRNTMCGVFNVLLGMILLFGLIASTRAHRRWKPLSDHMCPSEDPVTHVCYEMTRDYTTCMVHTLGCDPRYTDKCVFSLHTETRGCYVYTCEQTCCCAGCEEDSHGQCVPGVELGERTCENGGTARSDGRCSCPGGFSGSRCQTQSCDLRCENGGDCEIVNGAPECICPSPLYSGSRCEIACCEGQCMNGGVCRQDGVMARCECPPGFKGHTCDIVDNPSCPLSMAMKTMDECGLVYSSSTGCHSDSDCAPGSICCYDGCQGICSPRTDRACVYHGMTYQYGQSFVPVDTDNGCQRCVCQMNGEVECTNITASHGDCQQYGHLDHINSFCCAVCTDDDYHFNIATPYFTNCPEKLVAIETGYNNDMAHLPPLNLTARSANGQQLPVIYSRTQFFHSHSTDVQENIHRVSVMSDCDNSQKRAECILNIQVKDPHPPVFTSCPADIYALNDEPITWPEPVSNDNVGIYKVRTTRDHIRHTTLPVGTYRVSYTVWDFDLNQAICSFRVKVFDKDVDDRSMPPKLKSRLASKPQMSAGTIIGLISGLLFGMLVLALLTLGARRYVRQTADHARRGPNNENATTNTVYTITGQHEGVVRNAFFDGGKLPSLPPLPEYTPPYSPPSYDEIERYDRLGGRSADDTPIYETLAKRTDDEPVYENVAEGGNINHGYANDAQTMDYLKI